MWVFARLRRFYWPYRWTLLLAVASMGLLTAIGIIRPYLTKWLIDDVIRGGRMDLLWPIGLAVVAVALVRGIFNYGRQYLGEWAGQKTVYVLRAALYEKLQQLSFTFYDHAKTGDLMSRLTMDLDAFRMLFAQGFVFIMDFFFMVGFGMIAMWLMSPRLTLVTFALMPFLAVAVLRFDRRIRPAYAAIRESLSRLTTVVQENITGIRTVKSFAREEHEVDRFHEQNRDFALKNVVATDLIATYIPIMEAIGNLSATLLLWYGGRLVIRHELTLGELVAFFSLIGYLIWPLRELGFLVNLVEQAQAAGVRLLEILEAPPHVASPPRPVVVRRPRGAVRFEGVAFRYSDGPVVLEDIELDAPAGKTVALLGATGSGKTTLVSLIPRFYDVTRGRVCVDGVDVRRWDLHALRSQVGFVLSDTFLFSASIRENIAYGRPGASQAEIERAARLAQAHEFIRELPHGYDTVVGERGLGLSGGQKQRIAIARAILADPRILVLDDATSSVDMETEYLIQQALEELMEGRTTFIIAHRLSSLRRADEILVLDRGRIVERGRHEELLLRGGIYRQVYDVQFRDYEEEKARRARVGEGGEGA
ncbi:MAG: ABC transporter ATP-binding protein [Firmicutes bacterium]|nr:ABC transporter ATP-binding protein [Bacillota bacterium]